jgi:cbb3-type cytochrome oxidase subunit 3
VGVVLVLLFIANLFLALRKFKKSSSKKSGIIDIEARVVEKED